MEVGRQLLEYSESRIAPSDVHRPVRVALVNSENPVPAAVAGMLLDGSDETASYLHHVMT